ncbi:MAG: AAA family ATPase, partial [Phenylobacterium sp.]
MTMSVAENLAGPLENARRFAALSGSFDPIVALKTAGLTEANDIAVVATHLAGACDTQPPGPEGRWLMRLPERRHAISTLTKADALASAVRWRRDQPTDQETEDLLAVLLDQPPMSRGDILAALRDEEPGRQVLQRAIVALDRAGVAAPAGDLLVPARSALGEQERRDRRQRIAERGFFGREGEQDIIRDWIAKPFGTPPVRCLLIAGAPGIGKSALLEHAVAEFLAVPTALVVRLDFDRAGLDVVDQRGLTLEVARQLGEGLGENGVALLDKRIAASAVGEAAKSEPVRRATNAPRELLATIGSTVGPRPILFVLDTLEVLQGRGVTQAENLFSWLDQFVRVTSLPVRVLAAGRGDPLAGIRSRVENSIPLMGLGAEPATELLAKMEVPPQAWSDVLAIADGNPLRLRLAGEIVKRVGLSDLVKARGRLSLEADFLYRFLLSRIEDPELRRLAHPGLRVRRSNHEVIREVLAPKLGRGGISEARAHALLAGLAEHHWLVEADPGAPGFLKHRSDMRSLLLPLLYRTAPRQSSDIDKAAIRWFARVDEPWRRVEAAYHSLQLMRTVAGANSPPVISASVADLLDADTLAELPNEARDLIHAMRGERTTRFRGETVTGEDDPVLTRELMNVISRQDWSEGQYLIEEVEKSHSIGPTSVAAEAVRTFLWRAGRWSEARRWLRESDRHGGGTSAYSDLPPDVALSRMEMRAEFEPGAFAGAKSAHRDLVGGVPWKTAPDDGLARNGALAMLLHDLPHVSSSPRAEVQDFDLVGIAAAGLDEGLRLKGATSALDVARRRLAAREPNEDLSRQPPSRLLAVLTPYAAYGQNLLFQAQGQQLVNDARTVSNQVGRRRAKGASGFFESSGEPVQELADLGLFAEWAGATAFQVRNENLALIARSAERWRRTMAGDWRYTNRPRVLGPNDSSKRLRDQTIRASIAARLGQPNPVEAALLDIGSWRIPAELVRDHARSTAFTFRLFTRAGMPKD